MARILVGVDGSPNSLTALRWALAEARTWGVNVTVEAVLVHLPPGETWDLGLSSIPEETLREQRQEARAHLREATGEVEAPDGVALTRRTELGRAAERLSALSAQADLLVVGSRGRSGIRALGSVSRRCAAAALCPVTIVPPEATHPRET
jgi:nucleotide-binding universal stress UspA family protein